VTVETDLDIHLSQGVVLMNPIEQLIQNFQHLVAQVPELIQPFIVMLAGAVPFIEGEGSAIIGIVGGINPIVAAAAGIAGNFLSVLVVVLVTSRARSAVVTRRRAGAVTAHAEGSVLTLEAPPTTTPAKPESKGRIRFKKWLVRFGVPGASILGPLAIPTQFIAASLIAGGTSRARVLLWQAVAIVFWTTIGTASVWLALQVIPLIRHVSDAAGHESMPGRRTVSA
jgi:hypothetical protein